RHLEEVLPLQMPVLDGGDQVGAPVDRVLGAAAGVGAAAPLIGEDDGVAGVVEGRRVPVGHVGVEQLGDARGVLGVGDVQQDAVAAAGAGGQRQVRIDGDVVAVVGLGGVLGGNAGGSAAPPAGDGARLAIGEDARAVDDRGLFRCVQRHLDHVDREQGRLGVLFGLA